MCAFQSGVRSAKIAQPLEWQICDTDAEWQARQQDPVSAAVLQPDSRLRPTWVARHGRIGTGLLIVLAIIGGWIWSVVERGIAQVETDPRASTESDLWREAMQDDSKPSNHDTTEQKGTCCPTTTGNYVPCTSYGCCRP